MTSKIIVGVDGSDTSFRALRWAVAEAERRGAEVRLVACYALPVFAGPDGAVYPGAVDIDTLKHSAAAVVNRGTALVKSIDPDVVVDGVTALGVPADVIIEEAQPGDEIVVGTTGHSGLFGGLVGSVASGVIHRAHVPVVAVPAMWADAPVRRIVVGVDGSHESLVAMDWAYAEAAATGAELVVVHAWLYPYPVSAASPREVRRPMEFDAACELERCLDHIRADIEEGTVTVHSRLYEDAAVDALLTESKDADLMVVGCRGRGGLRARLLGSVSRAMVQHSQCPVAVVRCPEHGDR
jgi:nucleotide-binding universal stress UspA family protein